jgi:predicted nucleic acid-binding protein
MELWQFPQLGRQEEIELVALTRFYLKEVPLPGSVAKQAGVWLRSFSRNARRVLAADALIAATALENGDTVRTRNSKEMRKFPAKVQTY